MLTVCYPTAHMFSASESMMEAADMARDSRILGPDYTFFVMRSRLVLSTVKCRLLAHRIGAKKHFSQEKFPKMARCLPRFTRWHDVRLRLQREVENRPHNFFALSLLVDDKWSRHVIAIDVPFGLQV